MRRSIVLRVFLVAGVLALVIRAPVGAQTDADPKEDAAEKVSVFDQFVVKGGPITWFVLIPMSVAMAAMSIGQFLLARRSTLIPPVLRDELADYVENEQYDEALELTEDDPSMLGSALHAGLNERQNGHEATARAIGEAIEERAARLLRRIEHLNVLGNVAPMVGLFGTVYGMIRAFQILADSGGVPDPGKLAAGISVALVTTFWGLLIAIPALSVYAISRNRVDALIHECALTAEELLIGASGDVEETLPQEPVEV